MMIYDADQCFVPQRNRGSGANYTETQSGEPYWIAPCRKDGRDSLQPRVVQIDEEVREEYWHYIRALPNSVLEASYHSPGNSSPPVG